MAKWAPLNGFVVTVQTERLLRFPVSFGALPTLSFSTRAGPARHVVMIADRLRVFLHRDAFAAGNGGKSRRGAGAEGVGIRHAVRLN